MYKKYLLNTIFFLMLFSVPICGNWLFLLNNGELLPVEEIVEHQLGSNAYTTVGLATRYQGYYYKRQMYQTIKPDVLVLGSSRVMQFKKEFFSQRMFNAGGAMASVQEGYSFLKDALAVHKPKMVLIGIDYWWFNPSVIDPTAEIKPPLQLSHQISLRSYLLPYKWLWEKKISFAQYFQMMNPMYAFKPQYAQGIGVDGHLNHNGFAPDGSYAYTKTVVGKEKSIDEHFQTNLDLIAVNDTRYEKDAKVHPRHWQHFLEMLAFLEQQQVPVVLFISPLAPAIVEKLDYKIVIDDLRQHLQQQGIAYYDFHNPQTLLATHNCEFIDGTHGGDVIYAKMLSYMGNREPHLNAYLNVIYLDRVTHHLNNLAMIPREELSTLPETDFLQIGCDKSAQFSITQQALNS